MEADRPLISVAMCTYNGARFIEPQLDSILNQSYRHLEIVISDDGSSDDTVHILRRYQSQDHRIRVIEGGHNLGFVRNFQRALSACSGSLIALADQDDIWFPEKIASLARDIGDALLIYSKVRMVDAEGALLDREFPSVKRIEGRSALSLVVDNCVIGHACLVRRELLDRALPFPSGVLVHDQWLAVAAAATGGLKAGDQVLSYYRQHANNAVLGGKRRRNQSRARKILLRDQKHLAFARATIESGLLAAQDADLLREFCELLQKNSTAFYNWPLSRFLLRHGDDFLGLYKDKDEARRKLCRGVWYFRLLPFA